MPRDFLLQLLRYFWPANMLRGFRSILAEWYRGDVKDKGILLLIFAPMLICTLGLLYTFASFIFEIIAKLLGWFLLTVLFGGGGIFCYEKLRESRTAPR